MESFTQARYGCTCSLAITLRSFASRPSDGVFVWMVFLIMGKYFTGSSVPSAAFHDRLNFMAADKIRKRPTDISRYFPVLGMHKIRAAAQVLRRRPGTFIRSRPSPKIQACSSPSQQECSIFAGVSRQSPPLRAPCQNAASISAVLAYNANASKSTFGIRHFAFFIRSKARKRKG